MTTRTTRTRWAVAAAIGLFAAAALAEVVIADPFREADPLSFEADLGTGEITRVAGIAAVDGLPARGVFVQVTRGGQLCLWDAPSAWSRQRGGGCNPADDPLGGSPITVSLAYDGGPAVAGVTDARLVGLAAGDVAAVDVLMSDHTRRGIRLSGVEIGSLGLRAFGYRFRASDLRRGIAPVAVVALDASGAEVAREATGFGG
jgi:hypothetical protein